MKIIDTFLFSEPFETEILLIKFHLEDAVVSQWILVENDYTFQGEFKGYFAESILANDSRFSKYLERIKVLKCSIRPEVDVYNKSGIYDKVAFKVEHMQREVAREHLIGNFGDDDYVLITDTDEAYDFSDSARKKIFFEKLKTPHGGVLKIPRTRYWFDFDNLWLANRATPCVSIGLLKQSPLNIGEIRGNNLICDETWGIIVLFEYSFCFSKEYIERKYNTFSHTGVESNEIEMALRNNHIPISGKRGLEITYSPDYWLYKTNLTPRNSPKYVRDHFQVLKTDIVDKNYPANRRKNYPHIFPEKFPNNLVARARRSNRLRFLYKKSKLKSILSRLGFN